MSLENSYFPDKSGSVSAAPANFPHYWSHMTQWISFLLLNQPCQSNEGTIHTLISSIY